MGGPAVTLPFEVQLLLIGMSAWCGLIICAISEMIATNREPLPVLRYIGRARVAELAGAVGAEPTVPLRVPGYIPPADLRRLKARWREAMAAPPRFEVLVDGLILPVMHGPAVGRHRAEDA
jgi:hypothetical protein